MPTVEQLTAAVAEYVRRVGTGTSADIAALYAEDATVEDPVGSPARRGRADIADFYSALDPVDITAELLTVRVSGDTAAFHMRVTTTAGDLVTTIEPIDVMTFDEHGLITSMRAIWSPGDVVVHESASD
ncbi:nuclear transport factor 2 family protein [Nocardia brevicatena]|uniref:nuclear transport factor 2 family protein n=1 Tax=Nocardia brevicatena TaxID=37327 RepID=UPI00030C3819|nr:nuclear transport factor 2 family protein [Nocardia brevicatena]